MYKIDENYIKKAIDTFCSLIKNKEEGAPNTRYRSWEWCYKAFEEEREKYKKANKEEQAKIVDYLALHLAFYLASWGMYRGSSYLLQRDYKTHKRTVEYLLDSKYDSLQNYTPTKEAISSNERSKAAELIFNNESGLYRDIVRSYRGYEGANEDDASDTLVTKILMGTLGCVPAFDRFLKKGIKWLKEKYANSCIGREITCTIENGKNYGKNFRVLEQLAVANEEALRLTVNGVEYPTMKCVDMFLWQIGYELDMADKLEQDNVDKEKLIKMASKMEICNENDNAKYVADRIRGRWN